MGDHTTPYVYLKTCCYPRTLLKRSFLDLMPWLSDHGQFFSITDFLEDRLIQMHQFLGYCNKPVPEGFRRDTWWRILSSYQ